MKYNLGDRVTIEGTISALDGEGLHITIRDGELPPVGTFYFSHLAGIRKCPPTCSECGTDMMPYGAIFRCDNCGTPSAVS